MKKTLSTAIILAGLLVTSQAFSADVKVLTPSEEGKKIAYDRSKGNCLACHMVGDGESPGEIGPPLMAMKDRYPDKQKLFDKIWGKPGVELMPDSQMLPFGRNQVLTDEEINKVVEFLYTL